MGQNTKIEWADHTANPWHGCAHALLSDGSENVACANCYAEALAKRNSSVLGVWGEDGTRVLSKSFAENCRRWNDQAAAAGRKAIVFPSLCDPFEDFQGRAVLGLERMPAAALEQARREMFGVIDECHLLIFTLLTKRPQNVPRFWCSHANTDGRPPSRLRRQNVWLLYSAGDQKSLDDGLGALLDAKPLCGAVGLSLEPLVGPVDLNAKSMGLIDDPETYAWQECGVASEAMGAARELGWRTSGLDWVIVGGESGPNARPMHPAWVRLIRDQCLASRTPFFFKQWGEWAPFFTVGVEEFPNAPQKAPVCCLCRDGTVLRPFSIQDQHDHRGSQPMIRVGKTMAGRLLDGREWNEFPAGRDVQGTQP